jgi:hypothetical protein
LLGDCDKIELNLNDKNKKLSVELDKQNQKKEEVVKQLKI